MATIQECRAALDRLAGRMASAPGGVPGAAGLDRSLSCRITDLDVTFTGRLRDGGISVEDMTRGAPRSRAQIRITATGDDLVAMVDGGLSFARAWSTGRVRLEAGVRDLLRLRRLL